MALEAHRYLHDACGCVACCNGATRYLPIDWYARWHSHCVLSQKENGCAHHSNTTSSNNADTAKTAVVHILIQYLACASLSK